MTVMTQRHNCHLVDPSPWPLYTSLSLLNLVVFYASFMHEYIHAWQYVLQSLSLVVLMMTIWFRDVIREGTFTLLHKPIVSRGLR